MNLTYTIQRKLHQPVDIAFLVFFRIAAGVLIATEFSLLLLKVEEFTQTEVYFSYLFFSWIHPWSATGLYIHIVIIVILALLVAAGFRYRITTVLLFLAQVLLFLMDKAVYQNHIYLYWLVTFLMIFLPAHRAFSLDARRNSNIQTAQVPAWVWYLLLFQISVVYVYAGIAKLYSDWLDGRPMIIWMFYKSNYPVIGKLLGSEWFPYLASYAGAIVDLTAVPLLLFKRTRVYGFIMVLVFHLSNVVIFGLTTFPWFALMMTALFFSPSWPRKLLEKKLPAHSANVIPLRRSRWVMPLLGGYVLVQLLLPIRHCLYPLDTAWTDEGDQFSWRMLIRNKTGNLMYLIKDQDGQLVGTDQGERLTFFQHFTMQGDPDMMLQYAHHLAKLYEDSLCQPVQVYLDTQISLNGWEFQPMVDPTVDLAQEKRTLRHYAWIIPWKPVVPLASTTP